MSPEYWEQIEHILDQVLPLEPTARGPLLAKMCAGDNALRAQVETLLASFDEAEAEAFLEKSPHLAAQQVLLGTAPEVDLEAGHVLGAYHIVRPLGRGGMGTVYLAARADGQFHKHVALKVVKRGMDTDEILLRFRYEREILARLEHPGIARLLDAGVIGDGRPYFALEYVEGDTIDAYCDRHGLSVQERLRLFRTVCEAVRYAHRNLVVHRDLKPSNILVDTEGTVKLLDFGIAKLLEDDLALSTVPLTQMGGRRLTPQYAAPEQVLGEPTTPATDVYALGVMLYELMTGRRPYRFQSHSLAEVQSVICDRVPERPSTVAVRPAVHDDGTQTAPEALSQQRAVSPQRLRRQLKGDLDAIVMMALRKEPDRRYASAGELLDDIDRYIEGRPVEARPDSLGYRVTRFVQRHRLGVAAAAFGLLGLVVLAATAWQANVSAKEAAQEAERADVTLGVIGNMLARVNPEAAQGVTFTARDLIAAGLPEVEALENQPRVQATMLNELGRVSLEVGQVALADSLHRLALAIQRRELGHRDPDVAESLMRLAEVYRVQGRWDDAEASYLEAVNLRPDYTAGYGNLGLFYLARGRYEEAVEYLNKVVALDPQDYRTYTNLGAIYFQLGRSAEARQMWERSVAVEPSYRALSNLATLYYYEETRYADAARMYEKALAINDQDYSTWGHLAAAYYWAPGEREKARAAYERAIGMAEERLRVVNPDDPDVLSWLATYYAEIGDQQQAHNRIERAVYLAPQDEKVMFRAAYTYERLGGRTLALQWIDKAIAGGYPWTNIERDPGLRELRADPGFQHLRQNRRDIP